MPETVFTGKVLIELNEVESTNRYAADLLSKATLMEGTVVTTAYQTGGRGYSGNSWESEGRQESAGKHHSQAGISSTEAAFFSKRDRVAGSKRNSAAFCKKRAGENQMAK
jgi:hypothetical protein